MSFHNTNPTTTGAWRDTVSYEVYYGRQPAKGEHETGEFQFRALFTTHQLAGLFKHRIN